MDQLKSLTNERRQIFAAAIICLLLLFFVKSCFFSKQAKIGQITFQENDSRHKSAKEQDWGQARRDEEIILGDSILTGADSHVHVSFDRGGGVAIDENSLVVFREIEGQQVTDLVRGNFRLSIDGVLKVVIGGEVVSFYGAKSEIQIFFDRDKNPQVQLISGDVEEIKGRNGKPIHLLPRDVAGEIHMSQQPPPLSYVWHLYDLYTEKDFSILEREDRPILHKLQTELIWPQASGQKALIQISKNLDFKERIELASTTGRVQLTSIVMGENFWRVSLDQGLSWSVPQKFTVEVRFLKNAEPHLATTNQDVLLKGDVVTVNVNLQAPVGTLGFVAEASLTPDFDPESTKLFWSPGTTPRLSFYHPGTFYYRFKTVSKNQELSVWSVTQKFNVQKAEAPVLAPRLGQAKKYRRKVKLIQLAQRMEKVPQAIGKTEEKPPREPSAVENTTSMKWEEVKEVPAVNHRYRSSQFSTQTFLWTLQSSQQYYQKQTAPVATGIGIRGLTWFDNLGLEGMVKAGLLGVNQAGTQTAMKDFEARAYYRFVLGLPFNFVRELQTSLFGGYEIYRNSGGLYASQYDLMKFGTSLEIPLSQRWGTGGEFVYGLGADGSSKQEIAGHINYFFSHEWSLGLGYRLNFFTAGSPASAPQGFLPYKEGYSEANSVLNYYF